MLDIDINSGDLQVTYKIINENLTDDKMFRNSIRIKKNDFKLLLDLTENGFERGEKRIGYWGVKYTRCTEHILNIICEKIKHKFNSDYTKNKMLKGEYQVNFLYDMLVDFHLNVKGIKGHNNVYFDIQNDYPKKKWLLKNDNKFLPSVLDSYGIKSKFLISCLNKTLERPIHLASLNYLCKLFGEHHIEYLKKIDWELHCYDIPPNNKIHELKNDSEKKYMVSVINNNGYNKEIDLDINLAKAVETDVWCYLNDNSCILDCSTGTTSVTCETNIDFAGILSAQTISCESGFTPSVCTLTSVWNIDIILGCETIYSNNSFYIIKYVFSKEG